MNMYVATYCCPAFKSDILKLLFEFAILEVNEAKSSVQYSELSCAETPVNQANIAPKHKFVIQPQRSEEKNIICTSNISFELYDSAMKTEMRDLIKSLGLLISYTSSH